MAKGPVPQENDCLAKAVECPILSFLAFRRHSLTKITKVERMWGDINQMPRECPAKVYHMPNGKYSESGQTGHMPSGIPADVYQTK